ncbi:MAG: HEAT repeat domain-containing protein [Nitrospinota bacterium]|nr:HEAT repeat domain-containing protein [Nitrospinota bacterium]
MRALLRGPDDDLRFRAAFGLAAAGGGGDPDPMNAVREAARRPEVWRRRAALAVLGRVDGAGEEKLGFLLKGLEDADPVVRRIAAEALSGIQPDPDFNVKSEPHIETALAGALEDSDARVREAAFESWITRRERKEKGET